MSHSGRASRQVPWEVPWVVDLAAVAWVVHHHRTLDLGSPALACKDKVKVRGRAALDSQLGLARCPWAILGS